MENNQEANIVQLREELLDDLDAEGVFQSAGLSKVNLFCCACCRLIWNEIPPIAQRALEVSEQVWNGLLSTEEIVAERTKLWQFLDADSKTHNLKPTEVNAVRAVICCMYEKWESKKDAFDAVIWTLEFCDRTKKGLEHWQYQMLLEYFDPKPVS